MARPSRPIAPAPALAEQVAVFFAEALGDSVADATEILDGMERLMWAMGDQAEAQEWTPPHHILLWRDQLEILRARVRCLAWERDELAKRAAPKAVA